MAAKAVDGNEDVSSLGEEPGIDEGSEDGCAEAQSISRHYPIR
jgi:hypothetical protein